MSRRFNPFSGPSRTISDNRQIVKDYKQKGIVDKLFKTNNDKQISIIEIFVYVKGFENFKQAKLAHF